MAKLSNKERIQKENKKTEMLLEWHLFRKHLYFLDLDLEDAYCLFQNYIHIRDFYAKFEYFKVVLVQRPIAIMRKEPLRDIVLSMTSSMSQDIFTIMNDKYKHPVLAKNWKASAMNNRKKVGL